MATKTHLGRRILAGLIDYSIMLTFFCVFIFSFGTQNSQGEYTVTGILALVPFFFWFGFIVLIEVFLGATVGNSIVGLQPKSLTRNNGQLTFSQVLKRHLMDPFDLFPFGLIGIITIKNTEKHQRLGDIWAKTIVTPLTEN